MIGRDGAPMSNLLFSVSSADPLIYFAVSLVLATAAFAAAWIPAWRASGHRPGHHAALTSEE